MDAVDEQKLEQVRRIQFAHFAKEHIWTEDDYDLLRRYDTKRYGDEFHLFATYRDFDREKVRMKLRSEWEPDIPSGETQLQRLLTVDRFESVLKNEGLWFSRIDGFSDEFEATLPRANRRHRDQLMNAADDLSRGDNLYRNMGRSALIRDRHTYINCWREGEDESLVFWQAYVGDDDGLAVVTTVDDFIAALSKSVSNGYVADKIKADQHYYYGNHEQGNYFSDSFHRELGKMQVGSVEYLDYDDDPISNSRWSYARYFHKRSPFSDEREFRAVYSECPVIPSRYHGPGKIGTRYAVDLDRLIQSVRLAPGTDDVVHDRVEALLDDHGVNAEVRHSQLDQNPYRVHDGSQLA